MKKGHSNEPEASPSGEESQRAKAPRSRKTSLESDPVVGAKSKSAKADQKSDVAPKRKRAPVKKTSKADSEEGVQSLADASKSSPPEFTPEAIAVRAYFLSEKRRLQGRAPDPTHDWLEAENELMEEIDRYRASSESKRKRGS